MLLPVRRDLLTALDPTPVDVAMMPSWDHIRSPGDVRQIIDLTDERAFPRALAHTGVVFRGGVLYFDFGDGIFSAYLSELSRHHSCYRDIVS